MATDLRHCVIQDSREKLPWKFENVQVDKLWVGDYTLKGFESQIIVERKKKITEIASNMFQERFVKVLEKLNGLPNAFIVMEHNMKDIITYPKSAPPSIRSKTNVSGAFLMKKITQAMLDYPNIKWIWAGTPNQARIFVVSLFKRFLEGNPVSKFND